MFQCARLPASAIFATFALLACKPVNAQDLRLQEVWSHLETGNLAAAMDTLGQLSAADAATPQAKLASARLFLLLGEPLRALQAVEADASLRKLPVLDEIRYQAALAAFKVGQASENEVKLQNLHRAAALMSQVPLSSKERLSDFVTILEAAGRERELLDGLTRLGLPPFEWTLERLQRLGGWAHIPLSRALLKQGYPESAQRVAQLSVELFPSDARATYALVYVLCDTQQFTRAAEVLRKRLDSAVFAAEEAPHATVLLAQVLSWGDDHRGALALLESVLAQRPNFEPALVAKAKVLRAQGDILAAARVAQSLRALQPSLASELLHVEMTKEYDRSGAIALLAALELKYGKTESTRALSQDLGSTPRLAASCTQRQDIDASSIGCTYAVKGWVFDRFLLTASASQNNDELKEGSYRHDSAQLMLGWKPAPTADVEVGLVHGAGGLGLRVAATTNWTGRHSLTVESSGNDQDIPARALARATTSESLSSRYAYRNGTTSFRLSAKRQSLSDANVKTSASAVVELSRMEQQLNYPRLSLSFGAGVDAARRVDVSYYNPTKVAWTNLQLGGKFPDVSIPGSAWKLSSKVEVEAGRLREQGYASGNVLGASLRVAAKRGSLVPLTFSAARVQRPYDGVRTFFNVFSASVEAAL